jgi:hypothetical protein
VARFSGGRLFLSGPLRRMDRSKIGSPLAGPAVSKNVRA